MSGAPILTVRGLHKRFGALTVTQDLHLEIGAGELHALIGPNGAGKSSLIGQIMGTLAPDAGSVFLAGEAVTHLPTHLRAQRGLARSFQIGALIPGLSTLENAALAVQARSRAPLRPFGRAAREAVLNGPALDALAAVGLEARASVPARELAHGEKRALEIACALALWPCCILLDEPLAGMGHDEAARIIALLHRLKGRFGMLLVEHDMDAVFALADRVSVLVAGRIIASGAPAEVRADPVVRAAYLGEESC